VTHFEDADGHRVNPDAAPGLFTTPWWSRGRNSGCPLTKMTGYEWTGLKSTELRDEIAFEVSEDEE